MLMKNDSLFKNCFSWKAGTLNVEDVSMLGIKFSNGTGVVDSNAPFPNAI